MRIGFFTSIIEWGGSEIYLKTLMDGCRKLGHEVVLFGVKGSRLFKEIQGEGGECHAWRVCLPPLLNGEKVSGTVDKVSSISLLPVSLRLLAGNIREAYRLSRLFRIHAVDVIHVNVHGYEIAGVACRCAGIPSVSMNLNLVPEEHYWPRRMLMKFSAKAYTISAAQSPACIKSWVQWSHLDHERTAHVWNGIDIERFTDCAKRRAQRPRDGVFRFVTVARLHPMKGNRYLIQAMSLLRDVPVELDIIGDGEEWEMLNEIVDREGLSTSVRLHGHVESFDHFLDNADAFVLASVSHESCPGVLPQAMAAGMPLVTSDFGPLREVNLDGETGYVSASRDAVSLAAAMRRMATDRVKAESMGVRAQSRALKFFSAERMVCDMLAVYERAIGVSGLA